jgi:hypothetical protein
MLKCVYSLFFIVILILSMKAVLGKLYSGKSFPIYFLQQQKESRKLISSSI